MTALITKRGVLDTVQDLGRIGFRKLGINPNGAMDKWAVRLINTLLQNSAERAVIEMHFPAPHIEFLEDVSFALGGGNFSPTLNKKAIDNWRIHNAKTGDILRFGTKVLGNCCYLAVGSGFNFKEWLNSSSTNLKASLGGFCGRALKKGDIIEFDSGTGNPKLISGLTIARSLLPDYSGSPTIRIVAGPEYECLTALSELKFLKQPFVISNNSDRMGFHLTGPPLHLLDKTEIISSAVNFGTIQLLPSGQLVVLMADHQTSGGYPRIGNIIEPDLPLIGQLTPEDKIKFRIISIKEAESIKFQSERDLSFLRFGLNQPSL